MAQPWHPSRRRKRGIATEPAWRRRRITMVHRDRGLAENQRGTMKGTNVWKLSGRTIYNCLPPLQLYFSSFERGRITLAYRTGAPITISSTFLNAYLELETHYVGFLNIADQKVWVLHRLDFYNLPDMFEQNVSISGKALVNLEQMHQISRKVYLTARLVVCFPCGWW